MPDPKIKVSFLQAHLGRYDRSDDRQVKGKALPETKDNKFPIVETWRENVDGKYWFPADARADDELVFDSGNVIKIRMRVKYGGYKVGRSDVRVLGEDEDVTPTPTPAPTPKKP